MFNDQQNTLYPDSVVGTDSHTTMINGLGVVGWGVGGIEAEGVMLDQVGKCIPSRSYRLCKLRLRFIFFFQSR